MDYSGVIGRVDGYSDVDMLEYCQRLGRVTSKLLSETKGKKVITRPKYRMPDGYHEYIERSVNHYKSLIAHRMENKIQLRDYQEEIARKSVDLIGKHGFVYLAMEVRTGKTLTSMSICDRLEGVENVLFLTKKKAIKSISDDLKLLCPSYIMWVINYESAHKLPNVKWDVIICDEAHSLGAFPKPSQRAVMVKKLVEAHKSKVILLSGTPTPESYSQMYHQTYGIPGSPFRAYKNFYRWADDYVKVTSKLINGVTMKDYSAASGRVLDDMAKYTLSFSQVEAGFVVKTTEEVMYVDLEPKTMALIEKLRKTLVVEGKNETILADTSVKLMTKLHQMYSGTVKFESGNSMVLDLSKARFIKEKFAGRKIGIFYKFTEELNALKEVFGDELTTDLSTFEVTGQSIALQIQAGREGLSLKQAECLVYYNIDFSATSYWQSRDRMTTRDRTENHIYWIFANGGIEDKIYKAVSKKKDYTISHFKRDLLTL